MFKYKLLMQGHDDHRGTKLTIQSCFVVRVDCDPKIFASLREGDENKICELQINHKKTAKFIGVLIRILEVINLIWQQ